MRISFSSLFGLFFLTLANPPIAESGTLELLQPLPLIQLDRDGDGIAIELSEYISDPDIPGSAVRVTVRIGADEKAIDLALYDDETPETVANFLAYIGAELFENNILHRSVPGFILQTGGFHFINETTFDYVPTFAPIPNEPGISNIRGTVAMAKIGGDPDSATSQWFINLRDNAANLDVQNDGFTVFGRVLGDGMDVADEVADLPVYNATNFDRAWTDLPLYGYESGVGLQRTNLIETSASLISPIEFSAISEDPDLLTVEVDGIDLLLTPAFGKHGGATVVITATGLSGNRDEFRMPVWVGETYESWRAGIDFSNETSGALENDPDGDGFSNLFEFAFGGDPLAPGTPEFSPRAEKGGGVIFGQRRGALLQYAVLASSDLQNWSNVWTSDELLGGTEIIESEPQGEFDRLMVRAGDLLPDSGKLFWKIEVAIPEGAGETD